MIITNRGIDAIARADSNIAYAKNDFTLWLNTLLGGISFSSVLDICCGNGNQLLLYAAKSGVTRIVGVDVSEKSLAIARERLEAAGVSDVLLKDAGMEDMFLEPELTKSEFELISCCYGLYYSDDVERTLREILAHLSKNASLFIVGPYGKNNMALFSLLERHFKIPELVLRSSETFMENEVFPVLDMNFDVRKESFVNQIYYPNTKALINYWKSSTFYFKEYEDAVIKDIEKHFDSNREFIVEKHVMAYIARKKALLPDG